MNRLGAIFPLFILMCCLPFAMSGCGGSSANSSQQAGNLAITPGTVSFGTVPVGQTSFSNVSLTNQGATPATVSQVSITGQPFTVVGANDLPVTVAAGDTYNFYVYFSPASQGAASGQLTIVNNASSSGATTVGLSGMGDTASATTGLSGLICGNTSWTGAGVDNCTVTLNAAVASGAQTVNLASNNLAVAVPASVTVPAGATSAGFTANVTSVSTAQEVTLTASAGSVTENFALELNAASPTSLVAPVLSQLSCGNESLTGAGTDNCIVILSAPASGGMTVSLASNNPAVTVPATVTVGPGAAAARFGATIVSVSTAQIATLAASAGGATETFALQLDAATASSPATPVLNGLSCSSAALTGSGTDNCTLTLSAAASGGMTVNLATNNSAVTVPATVTVAPGGASASFQATATSVGASQAVTLAASAGGVTETYALQLNASSQASSVVPVLNGLGCTTASLTGAATDSCVVTLSSLVASGGVTISLASNNAAVTLPSTVTVMAGGNVAVFTATASSVSAAQTVTLTATAGGVTETYALRLGASTSASTGTGTSGLGISSTAVNFGDVTLNTPATQSITLTSSGTAVTVSSAVLAGTGFSVSGTSLPLSLSAGQSATLNIQFDPTTAGASAGTLTIVSTSLTNPSQIVNLSGTGVASAYEVNLSWSAPTSSTDPVAGYNVYRSPSGASSYTQLNPAVLNQTSYVDTTVQNGQTYNYIVESVDSSGVTSSPSNTASAVTP